MELYFELQQSAIWTFHDHDSVLVHASQAFQLDNANLFTSCLFRYITVHFISQFVKPNYTETGERENEMKGEREREEFAFRLFVHHFVNVDPHQNLEQRHPI